MIRNIKRVELMNADLATRRANVANIKRLNKEGLTYREIDRVLYDTESETRAEEIAYYLVKVNTRK